jgi:DNA-directed RNA polymerase subunit RPC12/RpoP
MPRYKCNYCQRMMFRTPDSRAENPFCKQCLNERLYKARAEAAEEQEKLIREMCLPLIGSIAIRPEAPEGYIAAPTPLSEVVRLTLKKEQS